MRYIVSMAIPRSVSFAARVSRADFFSLTLVRKAGEDGWSVNSFFRSS